MSASFKNLDVVQLARALPSEGLAVGARGTVVEVFKEGAAYLVEFCDERGATTAMPTLKAGDIEPVKAPAAA